MSSLVWTCWRWAATSDSSDDANVSYDHAAALSLALEMVSTVSSLLARPSIQDRFMNHWHAASQLEADEGIIMANAPKSVRRVEQGAIDTGIRVQTRFFHVESDYYSWSLERRMLRMCAPSIHHLCKTLFFENTRYEEKEGHDLLVQYTGKLNSQKLTNYVRGLSNGTKKGFNLRVASEAESDSFTGYKTGGVTPLGMARKVPVILCEAITRLQPCVFWMGAGHLDWKVAVPVDAFVRGTGCFVVDLE
ncbi:hypothetical protein BC830DRAFT_1165633 [Chytriomyces sp. MP71]|nr:hypothetical protein BC830DRAFT_1165633 [Chytriomyces sp. MP71]